MFVHRSPVIEIQGKELQGVKSQTSDSFVNYFDGHFAYLKTLDFNDFIFCRVAKTTVSGSPSVTWLS